MFFFDLNNDGPAKYKEQTTFNEKNFFSRYLCEFEDQSRGQFCRVDRTLLLASSS